MIKYKRFESWGVETSMKEALKWVNDNNIDIINIFECRWLIYNHGVIVVYNDAIVLTPEQEKEQ